MNDLVDLPGRSAQLIGEMLLAQTERLEELLQQNLAQVYWLHDRFGGHGALLVIANDLNVFWSCFRPPEADQPLSIYPDAVLAASVA